MRALLLSVVLLPSLALAHSGGTDANGCHTNRKTGDYHCHNPKVRIEKTSAEKPKVKTDDLPKAEKMPSKWGL